jgi:phosphoenolpyruvate carboxylase
MSHEPELDAERIAHATERRARGFEKIDRDFNHLIASFVTVLDDAHAGAIARQLPWLTPAPQSPSGAVTSAQIQALSISFQLLNMVEENVAHQMRRDSERRFGILAEPGLWGFYLRRLLAEGWAPGDIAAALPTVQVEPVFTAHPTESKRITVLEQHRELYVQLVNRENTMWTPAELREIDRRVRAVLERLWRTGETLLEKPTVAAERNAMLYYFDNVLPEAVRRADVHLREAWAEAGLDPELIADPAALPRIRFGTWIGGDRDGHPLVTPEVTRQSFHALRTHALAIHRAQLSALCAKLSLSSYIDAPPAALRDHLAELFTLVDDAERRAIELRNPNEPWRQLVALLLLRLPPVDASALADQPASNRYYRVASQLAADLRRLRSHLCAIGARRIARADIDPVLRSVEVFGFHLAVLDVRQNSAMHDTAISQILRCAGMADCEFGSWPEAKRCAFINSQLDSHLPLVGSGNLHGNEAIAAVGALRELTRQRALCGHEGIGSIILSMTRSPADLLGVYFLAREAGLLVPTDEGTACVVPVTPLLETIDDLEHGPAIITAFLNHPLSVRSRRWLDRHRTAFPAGELGVTSHPPPQQVMIGYSDSNKDSGILAAQWAIHKAQRQMVAAAGALPLRFFHGRGGTVSRGAGPTHRFLEAMPCGAINGDLRLTEQGEVVAQKYANTLTASYNLDLLVAGTLYYSLKHRKPAAGDANMEPVMEWLAIASRNAYRQLLHADRFIEFYRQATPIDALELSHIGSRPARRTGATSLADLRAIPWVFSWSQSRFFLPGWFGVGSALAALKQQHRHDWDQLCAAIRNWPFLNYSLTNVETALLSADPALMQDYSQLVADPELRRTFMARIGDEYTTTRAMLAELLGSGSSARRHKLLKTIEVRQAALRALHGYQIELLAGWRSGPVHGKPSAHDKMLLNILATVNAIAAGLRTTG